MAPNRRSSQYAGELEMGIIKVRNERKRWPCDGRKRGGDVLAVNSIQRVIARRERDGHMGIRKRRVYRFPLLTVMEIEDANWAVGES